MRRIISVILSLIAAVTFTFSTFSFAYAGGDKPKATYITGTSSVDGGFKVKYKTYDSVDYSSWCDSEPISVEKATSKKKSTKKKSSSAKYYWVDDSKVYHTSKNCRTLKRSTSVSSGKKAPSGRRACKVCG